MRPCGDRDVSAPDSSMNRWNSRPSGLGRPTARGRSSTRSIPRAIATAITHPGKPGIGHAWAYLLDAGETIARLLDRADELEPFARFHFAGDWDADGTAMTRAIAEAVGPAGHQGEEDALGAARPRRPVPADAARALQDALSVEDDSAARQYHGFI